MYKRPRKKEPPSEKPLLKEMEHKMPSEQETFEGANGRTKGRESGLHKALKVGSGHKFTARELTPLLRTKDGETFKFHGKEFKMTQGLRKQIQSALNMLKK